MSTDQPAAPALTDDVRALREAPRAHLIYSQTPRSQYSIELCDMLGESLRATLDALERERASRQAAQIELEQAREDRNRARLQGERDARRVLQAEMDALREQVSTLKRTYNQLFDAAAQQQEQIQQLQRERDEALAEAQRLRTALQEVRQRTEATSYRMGHDVAGIVDDALAGAQQGGAAQAAQEKQ